MKSGSREKLKEFKKLAKSKLTLKPPDGDIVIDIYGKASASKDVIKGQTGIVYDDLFTKHKCQWDTEYPENPDRYRCIIERMNEYGLVERCVRIPRRELLPEEMPSNIHDPGHVSLLSDISDNHNVDDVEEIARHYDSIYFDTDSYRTAMLAAGSSCNLIEAVVNGTIENGMAVIRPPGHHAMRFEYNGFCLINNVAVAAQYAINNLDIKKILIVDFDVHHGQATQQAFYKDNRVLYFSIHRYENGSFWPNNRQAEFDNIGLEEGVGFNINVPLNETGCSDSDYKFILHHLLLPVAYEFAPEIILVSAGYDAAIGCPEGQMRVTPSFYSYLIHCLKTVSQNKVAVFLEGGYFLPSLAESAALTLSALLGDLPPVAAPERPIKSSLRISVLNSISCLRKYWKCFSYHDTKPNEYFAFPVIRHVVESVFVGIAEVAPFNTRHYPNKNTAEENIKYTKMMDALKIGRQEYINHMIPSIGYAYEENMLLHVSPNENAYEKPERLVVTLEILKEFGLLDRMIKIDTKSATKDQILDFHTSLYFDKLTSLTNQSEADLFYMHKWITTYSCDKTLEAALQASGCVLELLDSIIDGRLSSGIAIVRPPGHHAEKDSAGGFCFLNHVGLAAKKALKKGLTRVMIFDFDIHHGNGTQNAFYDNPNVLYLSIHRYEKTNFYPNSEQANFYYRGENEGLGFNVNLAWNSNRMGDAEYMSALHRLVLPVAQQFRPELLILSAGFDAGIGDPLGSYSVSPECFAHYINLLKGTCNGKILLVLEGGYNCHTVGYSMAMCCKALLGDPLPQLASLGRPNEGALLSLANAIRVQSTTWKFLLEQVLFILDQRDI